MQMPRIGILRALFYYQRLCVPSPCIIFTPVSLPRYGNSLIKYIWRYMHAPRAVATEKI